MAPTLSAVLHTPNSIRMHLFGTKDWVEVRYFASVYWAAGQHGVPVLTGAVAALECPQNNAFRRVITKYSLAACYGSSNPKTARFCFIRGKRATICTPGPHLAELVILGGRVYLGMV